MRWRARGRFGAEPAPREVPVLAGTPGDSATLRITERRSVTHRWRGLAARRAAGGALLWGALSEARRRAGERLGAGRGSPGGVRERHDR